MNAADYLLERAQRQRTAIITEQDTHTYGELLQAVDGAAGSLLGLGVVKGDRVGILSDNSLFWVASYLGALKIGAIAVPLQQNLDRRQLAVLVESTTPAAYCVENKHLQRFLDSRAAAGPVLVQDAATTQQASARGVSAICRQGGPLKSVPVEEGTDLAALMFTSGSTGAPRAVMVSHRNIIANTTSIIESLDLREQERMMTVLPFHYCFGTSLLHTHLRVGGSLVLNNRFAFPQLVLAHMAATECTGLAGVPSTYQILLRSSAFRKMQFPKLRKFQQAGGKLPNVFIAELRSAHPRAECFVMYGQTEATARLSCLPPAFLDTKLGSIGRGIPGVSLLVLDGHGLPVPPGLTGEIVARGENITLGYWRDPEQTRLTFRDGALWTGDLARVDADGFIFVVDRAKDFLKPSGHRVACKQIEDVLVELPEVVEAAVVGVPDDLLGEAVHAFIAPRKGSTVTTDEVLLHCKRSMPLYMVPRKISFLRNLPKNTSGKIDKTALRRLA